MTKKAIAKEVGVWFLTLLLVLWMTSAGLTKFSANSDWIRMFRNAGFPDWFRIFIGIVEVAAAAVILVPRTAAYAALTIIVIMLGALGTVAMNMHGQAFRFLPASLVLVVAVIVLRARWKRRFGPAGGLAVEH